MLMAFIEAPLVQLEAGSLACDTLSPRQRRIVADAFALYLMHLIPHREATKRALAVLRPGQGELREYIRDTLAALIKSYECNALYKPAILRLAAGDSTGFRKLGVDPRATKRLISANASAFKRVVKQSQWPVSEIGPTHLKSVETEVVKLVTKHAKWFASTRASFLAKLSGDRDTIDVVHELLGLGLVAARWYYPFRSGLHLTNTVRSSITRRGQSVIAYHTTAGRRRVMQLSDGSFFAREQSLDFLKVEASSDPRDALTTLASLTDAVNKSTNTATAALAQFIANPELQDKFVSFLEVRFKTPLSCMDAAILALEKRRIPYAKALAVFLRVDGAHLRCALSEIRDAVA